jgi:hypothetical protein
MKTLQLIGVDGDWRISELLAGSVHLDGDQKHHRGDGSHEPLRGQISDEDQPFRPQNPGDPEIQSDS